MPALRPISSTGLLVTALVCALAPQAAAEFMVGTRLGTMELYEIDTDPAYTLTMRVSGLTPNPNGGAWDEVNSCYYYAAAEGGSLFVWNQATDTHTSLGGVEGHSPSLPDDGDPLTPAIASAAYYSDGYYFVVDGTDDLYRVTFSATPAVLTVTKVADIASNAHGWGFGDLAVDGGGVIYGSGIRSTDGVHELFSFDLNPPNTYTTIRAAAPAAGFPLSQIAFDSAHTVLFATDASNGNFFTVNLADGSYTLLTTFAFGFSDLGGSSPDPIPVELQSFTINGE